VVINETKLYFIGMGLKGLRTCSVETIDLLLSVDYVFVEKYTNFIPDEIPSDLKQLKSKIKTVIREDLEDNDQEFLEKINGKSVALLIPGDPFIATTHNSLRISALRKGYKCRIIYNTSIISAAASASGLSAYRFGRTVTCSFLENPSEFPYKIIKLNKQIGAHTLVLLDLDISRGNFLAVNEAISIFFELEKKKRENIFKESSLVIGLAKLGYEEEFISAGKAEDVIKASKWRDIGPPQALIVCADSLHFIEEEALKFLWNVDFI
jgi:diphthine synthase